MRSVGGRGRNLQISARVNALHTRIRVSKTRRHVTRLHLVSADGDLASLEVTEIYTRWRSETVDAPCSFAERDPRCAVRGGVCPRVRTKVTQYMWGSETEYPDGLSDPSDCGSWEWRDDPPAKPECLTMLGLAPEKKRRKR